MKPVRYVTLDPTGNITCLVLDPVEENEMNRVTDALMERCEQVGYLQMPPHPEAIARLQMMGGEFCGNATMATAAYLAQLKGISEKAVIPLEVSGAEGIISCAVAPVSVDLWEGTVGMPSVLEISPFRLDPYEAVLVRMEGIAHLILPDLELDRNKAEALLRRAAEVLPDASAGLLQWDSRAKYMKPLVFVRKSGTLVWETGCGSGSTAVGAWLASLQHNGVIVTDVHQPGGIIRVKADAVNGNIRGIRISGRVRIGKTETMFPEE